MSMVDKCAQVIPHRLVLNLLFNLLEKCNMALQIFALSGDMEPNVTHGHQSFYKVMRLTDVESKDPV